MNVAVMLISPHYHQTYGRFNHVLMLRDSNGLWGFPRGPIGDSENPEQGARRVVMEQTGFRLDSELTPCDSDDADCAVFYAEVQKEFELSLNEMNEPDDVSNRCRSFWGSPDFVGSTPRSIHAPIVHAAIKSLPPLLRN